jgi:hypothetical protein
MYVPEKGDVIFVQSIRSQTVYLVMGVGGGFGLVVRTAGWHAGDSGSILGRDSLYVFRCTAKRFEFASAEVLRYVKTLFFKIYLQV